MANGCMHKALSKGAVAEQQDQQNSDNTDDSRL